MAKSRKGRRPARSAAASRSNNDAAVTTTKKVGKRTFKRALAFLPFWKPWDEDAKHPNPLTGTVLSEIRTLPAKGKMKERDAFDIEGEDETGSYCIGVSGSLKSQVAALKIGPGQVVRLEYLGEVKLGKGRNPMHNVELWAEE